MKHEPGIYFGLDEGEYHAVPALSASGIKNMMAAPLNFWAASWMNPNYTHEPNEAMVVGSAYHRRIVEGAESFYESYAPSIGPEDYPEAIRTMNEMRDRLRVLELPVSGNKDELAERLLVADPHIEIWDEIVRDHAGNHAGKTLLDPDLIKKIEYAAAMIEKHPTLSKCFSGGWPEVSIMWIDEETGVPMKSRLDYLKVRAIIDLKTFNNRFGKPVDRAIATEMANYKYHVQVAVYMEAVEQARRLIRDGLIFGDADGDKLAQLAKSDDRHFAFVFQQTGIAPIAKGKIFPKGIVFDCGRIVMRQAMHDFKVCMDTFGTDPWLDTSDIEMFDDSEFPPWMTE
jgi:hypothetical protein